MREGEVILYFIQLLSEGTKERILDHVQIDSCEA
jgi:hypothetical protein